MQVAPVCPATVVDYTAIILAGISMFGNVALAFLAYKLKGQVPSKD